MSKNSTDEITEQDGIENRKDVLLKATFDLLRECDKGPYVKNALETMVVWDGVECDGYCLMQEIQELLEGIDNGKH